MNNSNPTLRIAHKWLKKTVKKMGRPNLYFSVQMGVDSSRDGRFVIYSAMISSPEDGIAPITFAAADKNEFIEKIKDFYKNKISESQLDAAFHEAQILANERSIEYHKEQIESITNPDEPQEAEIVESEEETSEK